MFDRQKLRDQIAILLVIAVICGAAGKLAATAAAMIAAMLATCLYFSMRSTVLPRVTKDLFANNVSVNEFKDLYKNDADFQQAVSYVYRLSTDDFLRFTRLLVELRDQANQGALKEVSDFFRRTKD